MNLNNRTIFCHDNLEILQGINSNSIDLIYLDPPFNKKKEFTAPIGSSAEGASFKDWFREEDIKEEWLQTIKEDYDGLYNFLDGVNSLSNIISNRKNKHYLYNYCYLVYMAMRLLEMQRILKDTGSIYLHCDPTMSHYLKILMDIIFGEENFRNEINWFYPDTPGRSKKYFSRKTDIIFFYSKTEKYCFYDMNIRIPILDVSKKRYQSIRKLGGKEYLGGKSSDIGKIPENVWKFPSIKGNSKERTGYPTQKPLALLERIIKASTNENDVVLDPFCGCATTCIAAEKLNRQWIGIDISVKAYELVKVRLTKEVANPEDLLQYDTEIVFSINPPTRTDNKNTDDKLKKYVYIISHPKYKGEYKVGITSNTKVRLNSYQTSDPNRNYKLEYKKYTYNFRAIEQFIHEKYENKHEWIRGDLQDIISDIEGYK